MNTLIPTPTQTAWLIDSSIYVFKAWHKKEALFDAEARPIHATRGFIRMVYKLLQQEQAQHIGFAFDASREYSFRKAIYPAYKANRSPTPEALKYQFQLCRDFIQALGLVQYSSLTHEADDIIGSWATQQRQQGLRCNILTADKDLTQLVRIHDLWWDYDHRKALNYGAIKKQFGVWPEQIADQLAIAGDATDNIPGVPGMGMATAAKLLNKFGTTEILLSRIPEISKMKARGSGLWQKDIETHQDNIRLARQLTGVDCEMPDVPKNLQRGKKDFSELQRLSAVLGLTQQQLELWIAV